MGDFKFQNEDTGTRFRELEIIIDRLAKQSTRQAMMPSAPPQAPLNVMSYFTEDVSFDGMVFRGIFFAGKIVKFTLNFKVKDSEKLNTFVCTLERGNTKTEMSFAVEGNKFLEAINYDVQDGDIVTVSCVEGQENISQVYCGMLFSQQSKKV